MRREPNYLVLGATVATIMVLFVGVLLFLAGSGSWGRTYRKISIRFPHEMPLPKLANGAEVTCAGMAVGKVKGSDLRALPRGDGKEGQELYIVVEAVVDEQVDLRSDCRIRAEGPPLGGGGTLVVVHRGYSAQALPDGASVTGLAPAGLNAMMGQIGDTLAGELDSKNPEGLMHLVKSQLDARSSASLMFKISAIADDLVATSGQMRRQLDPTQQNALLAKLDAALGDIKTITGALRNEANTENPDAMLARLHGILGALGGASQAAAGMLQENRPTIAATLGNVQGVTAAIHDSLMPSILMQMDALQPTSLMAKVQAAADKTNATLANIQEMSGGAKNLLTMNQDSIDSTIGNLRETSEHLRAASREIRRNPWRLLYRPTNSEFKQVAVADAARSFSDAAGKLDAAFARLEAYIKAAGASLPADDAQLRQMQDNLGVALKNLTESEKKFWELFAAER